MAVHFVYRGPNVGPTLKHIRHFDDDNVLAWFQRIWRPMQDVRIADDYVRQLLGIPCFSFVEVLMETQADWRTPPATTQDLCSRFEVVHGPAVIVEHHKHKFTFHILEQYETPTSYCFVDDHYREANPGEFDYLLWEPWQLPETTGAGEFIPQVKTARLGEVPYGQGTLYLAFLGYAYLPDAVHDEGQEAAYRIEGIRLAGLPLYLAKRRECDVWPTELNSLSGSLWGPYRHPVPGAEEGFVSQILEHPEEEVHWAAYSDWRAERDLSPPGLFLLEWAFRWAATRETNSGRLLAQVGEHVAQASVAYEGDSFFRWILFDDCWASANGALANGILRETILPF